MNKALFTGESPGHPASTGESRSGRRTTGSREGERESSESKTRKQPPGESRAGGNCRSVLKLLSLNARSVVLKIDKLKAEAIILDPDLIAVTEAWANASHTDAYLAIDNYSLVMRQDRQGKGGGGILLYAKKMLSKQIVPGLSDIGDGDFNQFISCKVKLKHGDLNLYVVYRPPNSCDSHYIKNNQRL